MMINLAFELLLKLQCPTKTPLNIIELPKYCPSHLSNPIIRFQTTDCISHFGTNLKNPNGKGRKKKAPTIVTTRIFRNYEDYLG